MPAARLVLFAPNLSGGGAERVLARLATHWAGQGREVTLVTLAAASPEDFPLPPTVRRVGLGLTAESGGLLGALRNNLRRVRAVRAAFREARPEVVVSFIEQANVIALLAARGLTVDDTDGATWPAPLPVVISERTDPARHRVPQLWRVLRRVTYRRCAALVVLTEQIAHRMRRVARGRPVVVIPNGIAAPASGRQAHEGFTLLGVGRLDPAKGFDRLADAFARVAARHPEWRLVIVGDGPQRRAIELFAACKGIKVELPGRVADPAEWYARADLFALPSRYEGFPNALLEAMSYGLPVVAFDGSAAVRQVVRECGAGFLVPEGWIGPFAEMLDLLMGSAELRGGLGEAAREVVTRYGLDAFYARWDAVVDAVATGNFAQLPGPGSE